MRYWEDGALGRWGVERRVLGGQGVVKTGVERRVLGGRGVGRRGC